MNINLSLEQKCKKCNGDTCYWLDDSYDDISCEACKATGKVPSEFGLELIAFLKKYKDLL